MGEQRESLERVEAKIGDVVLEFCRSRVELNARQFRMADLVDYVADRAQVAPSSPDRILRQLKKEGKVAYTVIDRAGSLYRIDSADGAARTEAERGKGYGSGY